MSKKQDFTKQLMGFIDQASEIGEMCSDNFAHHSADDFLVVHLHHKYIAWKMEVRDFLRDRGLVADAKLFILENAVPQEKGGIEYGDRHSELSKSLRRAISAELGDKLKHINELLQRGAGQALGDLLSLKFFFRRTSNEGRLYRAGGNTDEFCPFEKGRYLLMEILIREKGKGNHLIPTKQLAKDAGYKQLATCRTAIHAIRNKVENTFNGVVGEEFIVSEQDGGYKIGDKITISFRDTP